jgi:hypothetical protein
MGCEFTLVNSGAVNQWNIEPGMGDLVDDEGFEPSTPALRTRCSPN